MCDGPQGCGPILAKIAALQAGTATLEGNYDELAAIPDLADIDTPGGHSITLNGSYQTLATNSGTNPIAYLGGFLVRSAGAWATGESVEIRVQVKIDGTNYVSIWEATMAAEPGVGSIGILAPEPGDLLNNIPRPFYTNGNDYKVEINQSVQGAGYHTYKYYGVDAKAS